MSKLMVGRKVKKIDPVEIHNSLERYTTDGKIENLSIKEFIPACPIILIEPNPWNPEERRGNTLQHILFSAIYKDLFGENKNEQEQQG